MERVHVEIINKKITPLLCKLEQKNAAKSPEPFTFDLNSQPRSIIVPQIGYFKFEMDETLAKVTISSPHEINASISLGGKPIPFDDITKKGSIDKLILMAEWATFTNRRARTSVSFRFDNDPTESVSVAITHRPSPPVLTAAAEAVPEQ